MNYSLKNYIAVTLHLGDCFIRVGECYIRVSQYFILTYASSKNITSMPKNVIFNQSRDHSTSIKVLKQVRVVQDIRLQ